MRHCLLCLNLLMVNSRASTFNNRGKAWWNKESYDKAIADYEAAIQLDPHSTTYADDQGDPFLVFNIALTVNLVAIQLCIPVSSLITNSRSPT